MASAITDGRTRLNLTQAELADAAGISVSTLSLYERGQSPNLRPTTERKLRKALGWTSVDDAIARGDAAAAAETLPDSVRVLVDLPPIDDEDPSAEHAFVAATEALVGRRLPDHERDRLVRTVRALLDASL